MRILSLLLLSMVLVGCKEQDQETLKISFDLPSNPSDTVHLFYQDPLDYTRVENHFVALDSLGQGNIHLDLVYYTFASADVNGKLFNLFTYPGGELIITGNTDDLPNSIKFSGKGANVNDYFVKVSKIYKDNDLWNGKFFNFLDSAEFHKRQRMIQTKIDSVNEDYFGELISSDTIIQILKSENEFKSMWQYFFYELTNQTYLDFDVTTLLNNPSFLKTRSVNYYTALSTYLDSRISRSIWDNTDMSNFDSINYILPQLIFEKIKSLEISAEIEELLFAKLLFSNFASAILTPSGDTVYSIWQKTYPESEYGPTLDSYFHKIETLESGLLAPEVSGITPVGDSIHLSDLKGKVVYIKVWATWCSPCLRSFPELIELQEKLAEFEQLVFLNISVDKKLAKWRDMLADKQIPGVHMNTDSKKLYDDFLITGIPRYILIDQNGFVVDTKAASPSESRIQNEILKLLENGR